MGEENNLFTNKKGQNIVVEIKQNEDETAKLLEKVNDVGFPFLVSQGSI